MLSGRVPEVVSVLVLRVPCYDSQWIAYAVLSCFMLLAFTAGLPAGIAWVLYRRRHMLTDTVVQAHVGFLCRQYGVAAYGWEAQELLRKLVLTSGFVLFQQGSPVPVVFAVLANSLGHVLHAAYRPFVDRRHYWLQHASLTCTTTVFAVGLLLIARAWELAPWARGTLTVTL